MRGIIPAQGWSYFDLEKAGCMAQDQVFTGYCLDQQHARNSRLEAWFWLL
jgi:hypothetical protein